MNIRSRTNAFCFVVVDRPTGHTKCAIRGTVHRTIRASLRHPILACTCIRCKKRTHTRTRIRYDMKFEMNNGRTQFLPRLVYSAIFTRTNALGFGAIDRPSSVARLTFRFTFHRTTHASFRYAVAAGADIP